MSKLITEGIKVNYNGKPTIELYRKKSNDIENTYLNEMYLSISETKKSSDSYQSEKEFLMTLKQDGFNIGEYSKIDVFLTENDLIKVRNSIDEILNYQNNNNECFGK